MALANKLIFLSLLRDFEGGGKKKTEQPLPGMLGLFEG
jgi:hypothetical protein